MTALRLFCYIRAMAGRRKRENSLFQERSSQLRELLRHQRESVILISRKELAARSGVPASSIRAIETGTTLEPGVFTVAAIAIALNLDIAEVVRSRSGSLSQRPLTGGAPGDLAAPPAER
jgi:transcriptional regulator with XRE-family HTH domain